MPLLGDDALEAVALAVRLHGPKRGWALAAGKLGIAPDTARKIAMGATSGRSIPPGIAFSARMAFRRERAAQLRAELAALDMHDDDLVRLGHRLGVAGGYMP